MPAGRSLLVLLGLCLPAAAGAFEGRLRFQAGQEYDTNVHRVYALPAPEQEMDRVVEDGLTRLLWQADFDFEIAHHRFSIDYLGGARLFHHQTSEHLVANRLDAVHRWTSSPWTLGEHLLLQDNTQAVHDRDYFLALAEAFVIRRFSALELMLALGGRGLAFKPDWYSEQSDRSLLSHLGPTATASLSFRPGHRLLLGASYRFEARFFPRQPALLPDPGGGVYAGPDPRRDWVHVIGLRARLEQPLGERAGLVAEIAPELSIADSNSFGSSLLFQRLRLLLALRLPAGVTLQALGTLQISSYHDGILLDAFTYEPEADENENSLVLRLSVRLAGGAGLLLQGALYRNNFGGSDSLPDYRRETLTLALSWDFDL
jgi:hypothetical protein